MKEKMKEKEPKSEWKNQINIQELVPQSVYRVASDLGKVKAKQILTQEKPYSFLIVEKECPDLTDEKAWNAWQEEIELAKKQAEAKDEQFFLPDAPKEVDSFHEIYWPLIRHGELSLTDRILLLCRFVVSLDNPERLFIGDYHGIKNRGIATEFYTKNLPAVAKKIGVKFIIGINSGRNISFFTDKLGRYAVKQLTAEAEKEIFPDQADRNFISRNWTIQFLETELIPEYVRSEEIKEE